VGQAIGQTIIRSW